MAAYMRIQLVCALLLASQVVLLPTLAAARAKTTPAAVRMATWKVGRGSDTSTLSKRVAILTTSRDSADAWCMGLLVAPDALLTYAHCVQNKTLTHAFFGDSHASFFETQQRFEQPPHIEPVPLRPVGPSNSDSHASSAYVSTRNITAPTSAPTASDGHARKTNSSASGFTYSTTSSPPTTTNNSNRSISTRLRRLEAATEVGDVANWVDIVSVTIHPDYDPRDRTRASKDLAIVRLATPRDNISPFQLLPDAPSSINRTKVETTNVYVAYRVSPSFLRSSPHHSNTDKLEPIGSFYRTFWHYCTLATVNGQRLSRKAKRMDQMCAIPSSIHERTPRDTRNAFVLVGDHLAGVSVCWSLDCATQRVVHPFALVGGAKTFLEAATQQQDAWTSVSLLFTVGGDAAPLQGYLTGLRVSKDSPNFCLGALIAPQIVLTAAHCVASTVFAYVSVGSIHAASTIDGEQIKVDSVVIHPQFNPQTLANDFALVELQYMSIQRPLALDNTRDIAAFVTEQTTLTLYGYNTARAVQAVALPLVDVAVCQSLINDATFDMQTVVCAGGEAGRDGCQGDSGAPLVATDDATGELFHVALASFGWGCGIAGVPAVYARISAAAQFIDDHVVGHAWRYRQHRDSNSGELTTVGGREESDSEESGGNEYDNDNEDDAGTVTQSPPRQHPQDGATDETSAPPTSTLSPLPHSDSQSRSPHPSRPPLPRPPLPPPTHSTQSIDEFIARMCVNEHWTPVARIAIATNLQSVVLPASASQFTKDTVATTLLASAGAKAFEAKDKVASHNGFRIEHARRSLYKCTGAIELLSSVDLDAVDATFTTFENRVLRKRVNRFDRLPGMQRLPAE